MKFSRIWCVFLLAMLSATVAHAQQGIDGYDFSRLDVDALTDAQIEEVLERAEDRGLTVADLEKLALARGMRPSQIARFRQRIYDVQRSRRRADVEGRDRYGRRQEAPARRSTTRARSSGRDGGGEVPARRDARSGDPLDRAYADDGNPYYEDDAFGLDPDDPFYVLMDSRRRYRGDARDRTWADTVRFDPFADTTHTRIFGMDLFQVDELTFEPSINMPTPKDYVLAPGDELVVDVWGAAEMTYDLPVNRDGTIRIENLGPIYVSGMSVEEAERRIVDRLGALYAGLNATQPSENNVYADVTLGRLRVITVHIMGEVRHPGSYALPSLSTVFNALYVCGGPNENGTFRRIQVVRDGRVAGELDVYDFLIDGRLEGNLRLQEQDIIKVDPYVARVEVAGEVKRPALFEVTGGETLSDVVRFAGSFTGEAYTKRLKVYRNTATEKRIVDVADADFGRFDLRNGDEVRVDPILERFENRVEIRGAVYREGDYQLEETRTVYGLIRAAEGVRGDAFASRGQIYRTGADMTTELVSFDLQRLLQDPGQHDIALRKDDLVVLPSIFDLREDYTVEIEGSVQSAGPYPYLEDMTLEDLIVMAGGLREEASLDRVEVARRLTAQAAGERGRIAEIFHFDIDPSLSLSPEGARFALQPFDKVFVRRSPGYEAQREVVLAGEVMYPGTYTIESKDERISDVIRRAGGLTAEAYARGARLIRTERETRARQAQRRRAPERGGAADEMDRDDFEEGAFVDDTDARPVGIDLAEVIRQPGSEDDLLVEAGDSIFVPVRLETVKVSGAVFAPANVRYQRGLDVMDYVSQAGGMTDQGDRGRTYVVYANGSVDRVEKSVLFTRYPDVEPGAEIVVPIKPEDTGMSAQERTMIISSIISVTAVVSTTIFQIIQLSRNGN